MRSPALVALVFAAALMFLRCTAVPNTGADSGVATPTDGGSRLDAGTPDLDAGLPDAGAPDAGAPDAGAPDAGAPDAGPPDAGPPCAFDAGYVFTSPIVTHYDDTASSGTACIQSGHAPWPFRVATNYLHRSDFGDSCGACVQLEAVAHGIGGPVIAVVDDYCPTCDDDQFDLSEQTYNTLFGGGDVLGAAIKANYVNCPDNGDMLVTLNGSSAYFLSAQVWNTRMPVEALAFRGPDGGFLAATRSSHHTYELEYAGAPFTFPMDVQVTDAFHQSVVFSVPNGDNVTYDAGTQLPRYCPGTP